MKGTTISNGITVQIIGDREHNLHFVITSDQRDVTCTRSTGAFICKRVFCVISIAVERFGNKGINENLEMGRV